MKLKKLLSAALISSSLFLAGCATLVTTISNPEHENQGVVLIDSVPSGVGFEIFNAKGVKVADGKTPQNVGLVTSDGYFQRAKYTIHYKGPKPYTIELKPKFNSWYIGNLSLGYLGIIGALVVDPLTGAMWSLPKFIKTDLNSGKRLDVRNFNTLTDDEKKQLIALVPAQR